MLRDTGWGEKTREVEIPDPVTMGREFVRYPVQAHPCRLGIKAPEG